MQTKALILASLLALTGLPTLAADANDASAAVESSHRGAVVAEGDSVSIAFEKYTLANGLEIILAEDHRLPLVAFNMWVHAGPRNETKGLTGFAHLFEHLMFAGTRHIARGEADRIIDTAGGTDSNGSTDFDRTNYFFTLPSNQLELGMWIKSDMLGYMIDQIDAVSLANQQDVVRNERRQSIENRPYGIVEEALFQALYPEDHPYHAFVMGSHSDIQSAKLADVKRFALTYYRPNNVTLTIVGDFRTADAKRLVEKYFGTLKAGDAVPPVEVPTPQIRRERRVVVKDRIELPSLYLGWLTPAAYKPGDAELDLVGRIIAGGKSGRLYKSLVHDRQIAQNVEAFQYSLSLESAFVIEVIARPGHTAEELEQAVDEELSKLAAEPPSNEELARARAVIETQIFGGLEKVGGIADMLNRYNQVAGDPGYLPKDIARYRAVTPADITRVVAAQLKKDARAVVYGEPGEQVLPPEVPTPPVPKASAKSERATINAAENWRNKQPQPGPAKPLVLPAGTRVKLANGLTVIHVANLGVPLVSAQLIVDAGANANPQDRPGLADFTTAMLVEGSERRGALALADELADLGTTIEATSAAESSELSLSALKANFPHALEILADVTRAPAFDETELGRQKKARSAALAQQRENPQATAAVVANAALYGEGHPLAGGPLGDEATIAATTRDDLQNFWRTNYRPDRSALVIAGDISLAEAVRLAAQNFGDWKAEGEKTVVALPAARPTAARVVIVDKPGTPQTALNIVAAAPRADTPDAQAMQVMNAGMGGLFTSRINQQLREVKGYTYGIYSRYAFGRETGRFSIAGSVRTDVTGAALTDLFHEVDGTLRAPMKPVELLKSRNALLLALPGKFDTNRVIASSYADAWALNRPTDYFVTLPKRYAAVDSAKAFQAAKQHVKPGEWIVVAVGDKAKIAPQIDALGRKPVEQRDDEGRLAK
jgi:zinc protease